MKILPNNYIELTTTSDPRIIHIQQIRTVWLNLPVQHERQHCIAIDPITGKNPEMIRVPIEEAQAVSSLLKQLKINTITLEQNTAWLKQPPDVMTIKLRQ